ncbi:uncharacterized protein [Nicotiana tomentosiformis]|uniref:uncharacterized protein n=1 Tax=Nicotiana tomentosiformis TaxID=4098 RepID=UPI00388CE9E3
MSDVEQKRLERFGRLQTPSFGGAESGDARGLLNRCQQILRMVGILETSGVLFTTFQLTGAAFTWWETYERSSLVCEAPLSWHEFFVLFLEKFVPQTRREELHRLFEQLSQEGMSVTQYEMRFSELARHVFWLVPTERERIRRFIDGLNYQLHFVITRESVSGARFYEVVGIAQWLDLVHIQEREEREAKRPRGSGGFSGISFGGQSHHSRGHPHRPAQTAHPTHRGASVSHGSYSARSSQSSFTALPTHSSHHASSAQVSTGSSSSYQDQQLRQMRGCFECGGLESSQEGLP